VKILITGASGYLGRAIVAASRAAGHETVSFARRASSAGLPGSTFDGDVRDVERLTAAATGCDAVCHSAALVSVWRPRKADFDDVNVGGLRNVIEAARRADVSRIAYTSSFLALPPTGAAEPGRWNDYQRTKVDAAVLAARAVADGAPLVRLYPGVIYGPGAHTEGNLVGGMIRDHLAGRLPGLVGADCRWSYAFIDDVAAGHVAALERGRIGAEYRLCGENARQMSIFEIVRDLTGRPLPRRIPATAAVLVGLFEELKAAVTKRPPLLTPGTVEILTREWAFDSDAAVAELGYRITPLRDGIARVVSELVPAADATSREHRS
jgi:NAD+-dependent farnesol dehydrogenase